MAIPKLISGIDENDPNGSTGSQVAASVNALIDFQTSIEEGEVSIGAMMYLGDARLSLLPVSEETVSTSKGWALKANTGFGILSMLDSSTLFNSIVDGELSTSNRIALSGDKITISANYIEDCIVNSMRAEGDSSQIVVSQNIYENSKSFNTNDAWTGKNISFSSNIVLSSPSEAFLIDQPAVTPTQTLVTVTGNQFEAAAGSSRCAGFARGVGTLTTGNIYVGNTGVDDLLHFEDKHEKHVSSGELFIANGAARCVDGSLGGDEIYTHTDRQPKSIMVTSGLIDAAGADAVWFQGIETLEHSKITITNMHIENPNFTANVRLKEGLVARNVAYDPTLSIKSAKRAIGVINSSDNAHNVLVRDNDYIRPKFIRGDVGLCFDPSNIIRRTSFADEGASLALGGTINDTVISYPTDPTTGVKFFRITNNSNVASTRVINFIFNVGDIDFQNLDCLSAQIMMRSSKRDVGSMRIAFPNAGPGQAQYRMTDRDDFSDFRVVGITKQAPTTANFYAAGAGTVELRIFVADNLLSGDYLDIAWVKVSHVRAY